MMSEKEVLGNIWDAIVNLDTDSIQKACWQAVDLGIPAYKAVTDGMAG